MNSTRLNTITPHNIDMEEVSTKEERVEYLKETYNLTRKNAHALYLAEMGYSHKGIAQVLDVTVGTARSYLNRLETRIGEGVTETLPKSVRYPTFPGDVPKDDIEYSGDYIDLSDEMTDKETSINRGAQLEECSCVTKLS